MSKFAGICGCVAGIASLFCGCAQPTPHVVERVEPVQESKSSDWITLFDGSSLDGWEVFREEEGPLDKEDFFIKDGAIGCKGLGYHWLGYRAREFGDFDLQLEFKVKKDTNSGVVMRTSREGSPPFTGFEVQILGDYGQPPNKNSCGAIYDVVSPMYNASKPAGEWNQLEVICRGPLVVVNLNGLKVIDTDFSVLTQPIGKFNTPYAQLSRSGYISLQDHWKPIAWYRNIRIKTL